MEVSICIFAPCYNEENIIEWMDYHYKCGFDYIIIYDDQSDKPVKDFIKENSNFEQDKYIVLENFTRQYFSGVDRTNTNIKCCTPRSSYFFNKLKPYISKYTYCLSIDLDEYLYLGNFNNIKELIQYYQPFDSLYLFWNNFKGMQKYNDSQLIKNFTISSGIVKCGKCIGKVSSVVSQTSPHCFDSPNNVIFHPEENYNFISKDVFNNSFILSPNSGLQFMEDSYFYDKIKNNKNFPYLAHYRNQSIETFLRRRIIDRSLLLKINSYNSERDQKYYAKIFFGSEKSYYAIKDGTFYDKKGITIINHVDAPPSIINSDIQKAVEYIYNQINDIDKSKINKDENGDVMYLTLDDISRIYWSTKPLEGGINYDILNFYYK